MFHAKFHVKFSVTMTAKLMCGVHILALPLVQYLTVQLMLRRVRQATQVAVVRLFAWVIRALEQIVVALIPRRVRRHDRFHQRVVTTQVTPRVQVVSQLVVMMVRAAWRQEVALVQ
jgi:hypothetical protein